MSKSIERVEVAEEVDETGADETSWGWIGLRSEHFIRMGRPRLTA